jgi:hypothetical protein
MDNIFFGMLQDRDVQFRFVWGLEKWPGNFTAYPASLWISYSEWVSGKQMVESF